MNRITIYSTDSYEPERLGWFDLDAAEEIVTEDTYWDGNNHRGKVSGMQTNRAVLYRTKGGRWVEHCNRSCEFNGPDRWSFLTNDEARKWLMQAEEEAVLQYWFPDTPEESGPAPQGGRPSIGPTINVAYPRDLIDKIDAAASKAELSRAAFLRKIAEDAVA
jgi:hypothetical protein